MGGPATECNCHGGDLRPDLGKLISPASSWEIAIKVSRKKLDLGVPYRGFIPMHMLRNNFELLPIIDDHLAGLIDPAVPP